ncbi:uncharacterized protein FTOL_02329 [Fusarium torulosum]|uniref:Uncharacterized protein n=1 Tax=Fusarium torulosum TaxID=33205 RepID=A0AAE8SE83_9HYPO|nr:uncharacterized protein FTOL_02329 [Fusarium torulosum]
MPNASASTETWETGSSHLASTPQVDSSITSIYDSPETQPGSVWSAGNLTGGKSASNGEYPAAFCVPLPCGKELWDSIGNSSWSKLCQGHKQTARLSQLTLGSLLLVRNGGDHLGTEETSPEEVADSLSEWCRTADDFGLLLWMATSLEHNEQTLLRNLRERV